jgi:hypothetical protein
MPSIVRENKYDVYMYVPKVAHASTHTPVTVFDGTERHEVTINPAGLIVEGQTSGEWVYIGNFRLPAGTDSYVELSNKDANGVVVADAVLFIPEKQ